MEKVNQNSQNDVLQNRKESIERLKKLKRKMKQKRRYERSAIYLIRQMDAKNI